MTKSASIELSFIAAFSGKIALQLPFFMSSVRAGFPSQADDYVEKSLDFNEYLVKHPAATFCVRASGDSMINAGIFPGDVLVVDRALTPKNNSIVIAVVDGDFTVKRMQKSGGDIYLISENPAYEPINVTGRNFEVWGIVTHVLHKT